MPDTFEGQQLKAAVKQLLKKYGYTYTDLAAALKVSLPTARRYMSKDDLSVGTLVAICGWLGISFYDLVKMAEHEQHLPTFLSEEQEDFFALFPHFCTYFRLLGFGFTPKEIEEQYGLSPASTDAYLTELEQLNLIVKTKEGHAKLNIMWPPNWNFPGPLQEKFSQKIYYRTVDHLMEKTSSKEHASGYGNNFFFLIDCSLQLRPSTYQKYVRELIDLYQKYNTIGRHEVNITAKRDLRFYTALLGIDEFDPIQEVMGTVKNIK